MAIVKTINANGSKGHHKFSLRVSEDTTSGNSSFMSYSFTIAPIQNGWDWYGFNIPYSVNIGGKTYTGSISSYNGSSTVTLSSGSNIEIPHNTDGTKSISISFSVTDNTGQSYTCGSASASDTMTLTALHKPPKINTATMVETNQSMINLGIPDTTIVPWLSQKRITLSATAYDGATLSYRLRHAKSDYYLPSSTTYQSSNVFNANYRTNQVVIDNGKAPIIQTVVDNKGGSTSDLLVVNISGTVQQPNGIPYNKPTLEKSSTTIKRKSGGGINLTDNKATINVKGLIYKGSDVIGNNNSVKQLGYKIWERDATEPSSYTSLTPIVDTNGNVTINSLEVSNINFIKVYKYKIILKDNYNYTYEIEDTIPTGQPIFTEYKDRVDFLKITVSGYNPFEYSTNEIIVGKWVDDKPIYRKVIDFGYLPDGSSTKSVAHNISNISEIIKIEAMANDNGSFFPIPFAPVPFMFSNSSISIRVDSTNVNINTTADFTNRTAKIILEYTKTSD